MDKEKKISNGKPFSERRQYDGSKFKARGFGAKPKSFGGRNFKPFGSKNESSNEVKTEGNDEKKPFVRKSFGDRKPFGDRSFGNRKPFGDRKRSFRKADNFNKVVRVNDDSIKADKTQTNPSFKTKKVSVVNISTRFNVGVDRKDLWKGKPVKQLSTSLRKTGGRNNTGRITVDHIGGGHKKKYRFVDFQRTTDDIRAEVIRLEYDPCRSCFIALIKYEDGRLSYIIAPEGIKPGMYVISGENVSASTGNAMPLKNIPAGSLVHNIEMTPGKGGVIARSAGDYASVLGHVEGKVIIELPSKFKKHISGDCRATIGMVSNKEHMNCVLGTAGANRHRGKKPIVRGRAMNHHDHAHGGKNKRDDRGMRVKRGQKTVRNKNHWS